MLYGYHYTGDGGYLEKRKPVHIVCRIVAAVAVAVSSTGAAVVTATDSA
jgi:hypothetical protein